MNSPKLCPVCEAPIRGRIDKIYCSIACKSMAQYEQRQEKETVFLRVDKQLKTNRKILKKYNRSGKTIIRRTKIHQEGFDPKYFTHYWKNKNGDVYFFCYDFGFLKIQENQANILKNKYLIVEWQKYMQ